MINSFEEALQFMATACTNYERDKGKEGLERTRTTFTIKKEVVAGFGAITETLGKTKYRLAEECIVAYLKDYLENPIIVATGLYSGRLRKGQRNNQDFDTLTVAIYPDLLVAFTICQVLQRRPLYRVAEDCFGNLWPQVDVTEV